MSFEAANSEPNPGNRVWVQSGGKSVVGRFPARIDSISRGRVRLLVGRPLPLAEFVTVELSDRTAVPACVIGMEARSGDDWAATCVFTRELKDDELQPFGARRLRSSSSDIRRWVRFPCETLAFYQVIGASPPCQGMARVSNISPGGVGLHMDRLLEVGKLLSLQLQGPHGQAPLPVLACVVYATAHAEEEWAIGCTFIEELSEEDVRGVV